jgi:hypothetical protein
MPDMSQSKLLSELTKTKNVNAQMKVLEPKWNWINKEDPCKTQ